MACPFLSTYTCTYVTVRYLESNDVSNLNVHKELDLSHLGPKFRKFC